MYKKRYFSVIYRMYSCTLCIYIRYILVAQHTHYIVYGIRIYQGYMDDGRNKSSRGASRIKYKDEE